ncbi:MAG: hypothetical protein ACR2HX_17720 [Pyrinomonadaceae bacterium]
MSYKQLPGDAPRRVEIVDVYDRPEALRWTLSNVVLETIENNLVVLENRTRRVIEMLSE